MVHGQKNIKSEIAVHLDKLRVYFCYNDLPDNLLKYCFGALNHCVLCHSSLLGGEADHKGVYSAERACRCHCVSRRYQEGRQMSENSMVTLFLR